MNGTDLNVLQTQLSDRRAKLQEAASGAGEPAELLDLIKQVDIALEKIDRGTYGICETCHESLEAERIAADPLVRNCLDHLSELEQRFLERDLDLAFSVQSNLLPKQGIAHGGWTTAYHYAPSGPVSGDYCDIILPKDSDAPMVFFTGDVSGKGVAASILMSHLHAIFRTLLRPGIPLATVVVQANRLFCEATAQKHFATIAGGSAAADGSVEICNAAHCKPVVIRDGSVDVVGSGGLPLGLFTHVAYATRNVTLRPGDTLLLYTDGLIESRSREGELYGEERLTGLARSFKKRTPAEMIQSCLDDLSKFTGGEKRIDDLTILVLQKN